MLKPHITVACVVQAEGRFLIVEETIDGQVRWNQPAGHLEPGETLLQAAARELWRRAAYAPNRSLCCKSFSGWRRTPPRFCASPLPSTSPTARRPNHTIATSTAACGSPPSRSSPRRSYVRRWWRRVCAATSEESVIPSPSCAPTHPHADVSAPHRRCVSSGNVVN